jgi:phosphate-selective porin OprO/OprP
MKRTTLKLALLAGSALCMAGTANAQDPAPPSDNDAETVVQAEAPASNEDLASRAAFLEAQVNALQEQLNDIKAQLTKATPSWKGMPQWEDKDSGWTFKPRGRIQYDVGFIENPDDLIPTRNLGFNTRVRRIGDAIITYTPKNKPWSITIGNHESMDGLEQITSSRFISFLERAQMNDAFTNTRRIGLSFGLQDTANIMRFNAGVFAAHSIDGSFDNDGWIGAARATYSPQLAGGMIHLGANYQHRDFQSNNGGTPSTSQGAPSANQLGRYRARPFLQTTDVRFVDTGNFAAKSDDILGIELAGIFKSFHFAGEAQWTKVKAYEAGDIATGLNGFGGTNTVVVPSDDPSFFSWYAELGYFLTGETRGYKNGLWDRTKVLHPFSQGGWGALQLNARYDYLDLDTDDLKFAWSNNFTTGVASPSVSLTRGGTQQGYLASLIWIPEDYVRFLLQFAHARVKGGPFAGVANPDSSKPVDDRTYGSNSIAMRAQVDF